MNESLGQHADVDLPDPFGTAVLRARVLDAWSASPARFREDANAEEDLVRGGYRDRVIVELAQNAADAATRAGVRGRLLLRLDGDSLSASNTGSPLDAAAVESLSTLRASSKRDSGQPGETVGRFGVGFAAVLAVTDEPLIASTSGAVRWSSSDTTRMIEALPSLSGELELRRGHVPVLRLPLPAQIAPAAGFDTTVTLPLRDGAAAQLVRQLLDDVDDALLLSLPALDEIVIEVDGRRRVVADADRWHVVRRTGRLDPALLADRPTEERSARSWSVAWARPLASQAVPAAVHAPTATDEPLELPALLIASFPLDPSRRHVAPGPLTDFLVGMAAQAYAEMASEVDEPLSLVPQPAIVGTVDGALRRAIINAMSDTPLLMAAQGRVRPRDAVAVVDADESVREVLSDVLPDLVADHRALDRLGARRLALVDVVDLLAELDRDPVWWHTLYGALEGIVSSAGTEAFGALPVPLADGRSVRGARGLLFPAEPLPPGLDVLGLRIVHPQAAHPLLLRLGAVSASARTALADAGVRSAVELAGDSAEPVEVTEAVLSLIELADLEPGELPWLSELPLLDRHGRIAAAGDLVLPGSLLAQVSEPGELEVPHESVLQRWSPNVLVAAGVLSTLRIVRDEDLPLDDPGDHDLPDEQEWFDYVGSLVAPHDLPPLLAEFVAVADLDLVRADAWLTTLREISGNAQLRSAVLEPARALHADGRLLEFPSYTAWWLRSHALIAGRAPTDYALAEAADLGELYDVLPSAEHHVDAAFLAAIGLRTSLGALLAEPGGPDDLLRRLADSSAHVADDQLMRLYAALAALDPDRVTPPERVRIRPERVVSADEAMVLDEPHHLQLAWPVPPILVPLSLAADLSDVLDVATTGSLLDACAVPIGREQNVPDALVSWMSELPQRWREHDALVINEQDVEWWVDRDGTPHACTLDGLSRALAWTARRWETRHLIAALLADPQRSADLVAEATLEG